MSIHLIISLRYLQLSNIESWKTVVLGARFCDALHYEDPLLDADA